ncbi:MULTISPECIES: GNAT family N-acetyltransferase [unclassified Mesorhizobium]|uniref:GNAT family N-acetyltransferase n=1 Tax=unclassified Mesorhizobium TaxID=325217 RepID=UPI0030145D4D
MSGFANELTIELIQEDFQDWDGLLALILNAFAYMNDVIDPPSSALALTPESLRAKAAQETVFLATDGERLLGCIFVAEKADHFYVGKLAVDPAAQGKGIGRRLLGAAEQHARKHGKPAIELQTRIELTGNHKAFQRLGFQETERTAHPGYNRPTSLTMRKALA